MGDQGGGGGIYQFKITLVGAKRNSPAIWRRIQLNSSASGQFSFRNLHKAISASMGWFDAHLHQFRLASGLSLGMADPYGGGEFGGGRTTGESSAKISTHLKQVGDRCKYEYDFGDGWEHDVLLEAIIPPEDVQENGKVVTTYPRCVGGERACPPEDCGGPFGYKELLKTLAKKLENQNADERERVAWLQEGYEDFDPEKFDPSKVDFSDFNRFP